MLKFVKKVIASIADIASSVSVQLPQSCVIVHKGEDLQPGMTPGYSHILVAEDDRQEAAKIVKTIRDHCRYGSITLYLCYDFQQCLHIFDDSSIDLVILDYDLGDPKGTGLDLLHRIRVMNPGLHILANSGSRKNGEKLLNAGACVNIAKNMDRLSDWLLEHNKTGL